MILKSSPNGSNRLRKDHVKAWANHPFKTTRYGNIN